MRVLVAFDKFKDALSAADACAVAATALRDAHPEWSIDCCPLADGGDGFAGILTEAAGGSWQPCTVSGPRAGTRVVGGFGLVARERIPTAARPWLNVSGSRIGVVEMASASGLSLLPAAERNPWRTTSRGTGELLQFAARAGADALLLGIGGSATHDLGLGVLAAWGWRAFDAAGAEVSTLTPENWSRIVRVEPSRLAPPPLFIASDVENPLLGPRGAALVYAAQKGAPPADLQKLEDATARMASLLEEAAGATSVRRHYAGAGAAGGVGYGLMLAFGAELIPGAKLVSAWLDLKRRIAEADLILTGEGRFDRSSLEGKGPGALVLRAVALGKPVQVFAGQVAVEQWPANLTATAISPPGEPLTTALSRTSEYLAAAVKRTGAR